MSNRERDVRRLRVSRLAADGESLQGEWPLSDLDRLSEATVKDPDGTDGPVTWAVAGELKRPSAVDAEVWMSVQASCTVHQICQRCLKPVALPLQVDRDLRFVATEEEAARLDEDSEDDVLAEGSGVDLRALIEDELLLELPIVPRHDVCPDPLPVPADDLDAEAAEDEHPFAALRALKPPTSH